MNNTSTGQKLKQNSEQTVQNNSDGGGLFGGGSDNADANTIKVGVVTWGGYAGGQYFNEGFKANTESRFYKDYGFKVDFKILDDFDASRAAWKKGDVDLLWATVDAFPTEATALADYEPRIVFQADWSRGGDAIVVRRGINSVADLKGKKIAVAEMTPSHSFLLWLLEAGGLKISDVEIVKQANAIDAAQTFKSQAVDAAVVWSPDDADCVSKVAGAKVLQSTRNASNIIADVFIAKKSWIEANRTKLAQLYEGWMKGAAEINQSPEAKRKAARILSNAFDGFSEETTLQAINNVRLCTHGDNINFFGLNPAYTGITGEQLYARMTNTYRSLGYADTRTPSWRIVADASTVKSSTLAGTQHSAEGQKSFSTASASDKNKEAIATKRVSINFRSGEYQIDENAKYIIDKEFVEIAKAFANARIRVEGNTDNVGNAASNRVLSEKRAQSVVNYMVNTHKMPRNRFIIVGNGPDNPVADNDSPEGRGKNRRTDFQLLPE